MGSGVSSGLDDSKSVDIISKEILSKYSFYVLKSVIRNEDISLALASWNLFLMGSVPLYLERKASDLSFSSDCLTWFYENFYRISFEMQTSSRYLLSDSNKVQIKAVSSMISSIFSMFGGNDMDGAKKVLSHIARSHLSRGICAEEYPLVCNYLLLTLRYCLGDEWEDKYESAWNNLISVMLDILVPTALQEEKDKREKIAQELSLSRRETVVSDS